MSPETTRVSRGALAVVRLLGEGFRYATPDECDEGAPQRVELYSPGDDAPVVIPADNRL